MKTETQKVPMLLISKRKRTETDSATQKGKRDKKEKEVVQRSRLEMRTNRNPKRIKSSHCT